MKEKFSKELKHWKQEILEMIDTIINIETTLESTVRDNTGLENKGEKIITQTLMRWKKLCD